MTIIINYASGKSFKGNVAFKEIVQKSLKYSGSDVILTVPESIGGSVGEGFQRNFLQNVKDFIENQLFNVYPEKKECKDGDKTEYTYVFKPLEELLKINWLSSSKGGKMMSDLTVVTLIDVLIHLINKTNSHLNYPLASQYKQRSIAEGKKITKAFVRKYLDFVEKQKNIAKYSAFYSGSQAEQVGTFKHQLEHNPTHLDFRDGLLAYLTEDQKSLRIKKFKENLSEIEYDTTVKIESSLGELPCKVSISEKYIMVLYKNELVIHSSVSPHDYIHRDNHRSFPDQIERTLFVLDDFTVRATGSGNTDGTETEIWTDTYLKTGSVELYDKVLAKSMVRSVVETSNHIYSMVNAREHPDKSVVSVFNKIRLKQHSIGHTHTSEQEILDNAFTVMLDRFKQIVANDKYIVACENNKLVLIANGGNQSENYKKIMEIETDPKNIILCISLIANVVITYLNNGCIEMYNIINDKLVKINLSEDSSSPSSTIPSEYGVSIYNSSVVGFTNNQYATHTATKEITDANFVLMKPGDQLYVDTTEPNVAINLTTKEKGMVDPANITPAVMERKPAELVQYKFRPIQIDASRYDLKLTEEQVDVLERFSNTAGNPVGFESDTQFILGIATLMHLYETEKDDDVIETNPAHSPELFALLSACSQVGTDECFKSADEDNEYSIYNTTAIKKLVGEEYIDLYRNSYIGNSVLNMDYDQLERKSAPVTIDEIRDAIFVVQEPLRTAPPSDTLTAFNRFLDSIANNTKLKENLLRFWSGIKTLNKSRKYQLTIIDRLVGASARPFPVAHTCFYQLEINDVSIYPGKTLDEKMETFIQTITEAITHYSAEMNMMGGRKRSTRRIRRVTKTKKRSHKNKHTKKHRK